VKVDTTPHDFTVCFFDCLKEGARQLGFASLTALLAQVGVIRWSATIASNIIAEGKGPRIGLLVSPGTGTNLYGTQESPAVGRLIAPENIVEVGDNLVAIRKLLEQGVRRIAVSLKDGYHDDREEQEIRALVDENFPDHYLGAVPLVLGSTQTTKPARTWRWSTPTSTRRSPSRSSRPRTSCSRSTTTAARSTSRTSTAASRAWPRRRRSTPRNRARTSA
jgi:N-methylhydantoinase A/oxoprolinase/acetone carboxylase beta subunit